MDDWLRILLYIGAAAGAIKVGSIVFNILFKRKAARPASGRVRLQAKKKAHRRLQDYFDEYLIMDDSPTSPAALDMQELAADRNARFANVYLFDEQKQSLVRDIALAPGSLVWLSIGIGSRDSESRVANPISFAGVLPEGQPSLVKVLVASADFTVGLDGQEGRGTFAEQELRIPADGGPGVAPDGTFRLWFALKSPERIGGAQARLNYYYRDALIQSQVLRADIGGEFGQNTVLTDYTVSATLLDLNHIPDIPRVSLFIDEGPSASQSAILRSPRGVDPEQPAVISLRDTAVQDLARDLRAALADSVTSERIHSKKQLIQDLRSLAPLGAKLHDKLFVQAREALGSTLTEGERPILSIARPSSVMFTLPWNLVYDIYLPDDRHVDDIEVCPLVVEWDEISPLVDGTPERCPRAAEVEHSSLLCPFGFWGFGLTTESPASSWDPKACVEVRKGATALVAETSALDEKTQVALHKHTQQLARRLDMAFPQLGVQVLTCKTKAEVKKTITQDLPIVYFFCHGDRPYHGSPLVSLSLGKNELLSAAEFTGWAKESWRRSNPFWKDVRPLVFINACEALDISPASLLSYVDAFVGGAQAMGVIGTDVRVPAPLAMEYADIFFQHILLEQASVERATKKARFAFLSGGNLFGLVYNNHSWSHLTVAGVSAA